MKIIISALNILGYVCTPATLVLAVLWFLQPDGNYEPITVALGSVSLICFGGAQLLQKKFEALNKGSKKLGELSTDEILVVVRDSDPNDWDVNFNEDAEMAMYKSDPSLMIETQHSPEYVHNDDFREKWANKFPDPHATSYYYRLHYSATPLKEFILVSVDGGRALLPLPKYAIDLSVEPVRYKIALIFDRFANCDEYMKRAGLYLDNEN